MADPERALQVAMIARLRAEPALQAVLGAVPRVWDQPPEEPVYPYVLFTRAETRPVNAEDAGYEHRLTLTVVSRYGGAEEAKAVLGLVRGALDGAALSLSGWRCVNLRATYADVYRAKDLRTTFGVLRLRAVTEAG